MSRRDRALGYFDYDGRYIRTLGPDGRPLTREAVRGMLSPVQCSYCQRVYDLGSVEVIYRYADCTLYKTPCCNRQADDRPQGPGLFMVSRAAFRKLDEHLPLRDE